MQDGYINRFSPYGDIFKAAVQGATLTFVEPAGKSRLTVDEYNQNVKIIARFAAGVVAAIETDRKPVTSTPEYFYNYEIISQALQLKELHSEDHKVAMQYCREIAMLMRGSHLRNAPDVEQAVINELAYYEGEFFLQKEYRGIEFTTSIKRLCEVGFAIAAACPSSVEEKTFETISRVAEGALAGAIAGDALTGNFQGILSVAIARALIEIKLHPR